MKELAGEIKGSPLAIGDRLRELEALGVAEQPDGARPVRLLRFLMPEAKR